MTEFKKSDALLSLSMKQADGSYKNYTLAINPDTDKWGNNVTMWEQQTKDQQAAKEKKKYTGNGRVVWINSESKISVATKVEKKPKTINDTDNTPYGIANAIGIDNF